MTKQVIFEKKNVLITGGAGFIGSHLCDELIKDSKVICLDDFSTGDEKNIDHLLAESDFAFIRHDITKPINIESLPELQKFKIQFQGIQEVYHLACPMSPKYFEENQVATVLANSLGVKNALDIAKKNNAKFMHFSSSVVYGERSSETRKVSENDYGIMSPLGKHSAYDEGKRYAETLVEIYRKSYNLDTKIIRPFRIYGPRMKLNDNQMIPDFISSALDEEDLIVHGDENFSSSFCYVSDCIDACVKLMESDVHEPMNIGSDIEMKISDLAKKIIEMIGAKSQIKHEEEKTFMRPLPLPVISKARNELAWMPIVTLEKGLESAIYEIRANKGIVGVKHAL